MLVFNINDTIKRYFIERNEGFRIPAAREAHIWRSAVAVSCLLLQLRYQTFQRAARRSRRRPCVNALQLDWFVSSEFNTMQLAVVQLLWDGEDINRRWVRWLGSGDRRVSEQHTESNYGSCLWVLSELIFAHLYTFFVLQIWFWQRQENITAYGINSSHITLHDFVPLISQPFFNSITILNLIIYFRNLNISLTRSRRRVKINDLEGHRWNNSQNINTIYCKVTVIKVWLWLETWFKMPTKILIWRGEKKMM